MKKAIPILLLVVMAAIVFLVRKCRSDEKSTRASRITNNTSPAETINRNRGFDRRTSFIEYTRHAECRMECRQVTRGEVEEIMRSGTINYRKSDVNDKPCPVYTLEGRAGNNEKLRIVFAQCDYKTKVVTVIDLDKEWQCDCAGDDKKFRNRN
jgi:hypothetical protein